MTPFDDDKPIRLVISITKADAKGKVLQRMSSGTIIAYKDVESATKETLDFLEMANTITGKYSSYGLITVLDESKNSIEFQQPL